MINILFVHPDQKLTQIYHQKLKDHFRVHVAVDGLSAVRMVRTILPRVVISDYNLPLLSGKSLVRFVRNHEPTHTCPFIFLSKHDFDPQALNLGANDWIPLQRATPELIIEKIYVQINRTRS